MRERSRRIIGGGLLIAGVGGPAAGALVWGIVDAAGTGAGKVLEQVPKIEKPAGPALDSSGNVAVKGLQQLQKLGGLEGSTTTAPASATTADPYG